MDIGEFLRRVSSRLGDCTFLGGEISRGCNVESVLQSSIDRANRTYYMPDEQLQRQNSMPMIKCIFYSLASLWPAMMMSPTLFCRTDILWYVLLLMLAPWSSFVHSFIRSFFDLRADSFSVNEDWHTPGFFAAFVSQLSSLFIFPKFILKSPDIAKLLLGSKISYSSKNFFPIQRTKFSMWISANLLFCRGLRRMAHWDDQILVDIFKSLG